MDRNTLGRSPVKKQSELSIFVSYFPGQGTRCRMLQAGEQARRSGTDTVIGALSTAHGWKPQRPPPVLRRCSGRKMQKNGRTVDELDLDACLKRRPELILIDELSHLNAEEARHMRALPGC